MNQAPGRILVTGASGQLGSYLLRELQRRGWPAVAWSQRPDVELFGYRCQDVQLRDTDQVVGAFQAAAPQLIIHAAAMSGVADCYRDPGLARQTNVTATRLLVEMSEKHSARIVYVSTDLVFDGEKDLYSESDCPAPLSVYGQTKANAERCVLSNSRHLVLRVSLMFGPAINGRPSFFQQQLSALRANTPCRLFRDEWRTPLDLQTAATGVLDVAASDATGILHFGGPQRMSRLEMGQRLARHLGISASLIQAIDREDTPASEPRPRDTSLDSQRWCERFPGSPRLDYEVALQQMGVSRG
jgi:dTDP-4-dehydrorhamnose reductase